MRRTGKKTRATLVTAVFAGMAAGGCALLLWGANSNASGSAPLTLEKDGHYTAPVMVNGRGPFPFIVDTGAQRSVISAALAEQLGLLKIPGASVHATSGNEAGGICFLRSYSSGLFQRTGEMMVILPPGGIIQNGAMGMDLFTSRRVELNFAAATVRSGATGATPEEFLAVPSTIVQNTFLVTDLDVDGVRTKAMLDTGARRTIGNSRLRRAIGFCGWRCAAVARGVSGRRNDGSDKGSSGPGVGDQVGYASLRTSDSDVCGYTGSRVAWLERGAGAGLRSGCSYYFAGSGDRLSAR